MQVMRSLASPVHLKGVLVTRCERRARRGKRIEECFTGREVRIGHRRLGGNCSTREEDERQRVGSG